MRRLIYSSSSVAIVDLLNILPETIARSAQYKLGSGIIHVDQKFDIVSYVLQHQAGYALYDSYYSPKQGNSAVFRRGNISILLQDNGKRDECFIQLEE